MPVQNVFKYVVAFVVGAASVFLVDRHADVGRPKAEGNACSDRLLLSRDLLNSKIAAINSFAVVRKLDAGDVDGARALVNMQLDSELSLITQASKVVENEEEGKSSLEIVNKVTSYRQATKEK